MGAVLGVRPWSKGASMGAVLGVPMGVRGALRRAAAAGGPYRGRRVGRGRGRRSVRRGWRCGSRCGSVQHDAADGGGWRRLGARRATYLVVERRRGRTGAIACGQAASVQLCRGASGGRQGGGTVNDEAGGRQGGGSGRRGQGRVRCDDARRAARHRWLVMIPTCREGRAIGSFRRWPSDAVCEPVHGGIHARGQGAKLEWGDRYGRSRRRSQRDLICRSTAQWALGAWRLRHAARRQGLM